MKRILAANEMIRSFEVGNNLRETEHGEAKMPRHSSLNRRAWPEVKRGEGHGFDEGSELA
jgi:hypothetical protein